MKKSKGGVIYSRSLISSEERAVKYDSKLLCTNKRFNNTVLIIDMEGSMFLIEHAFMMYDPKTDNYLWVFAEHHKPMVFATDELIQSREFKRENEKFV